MKVTPILSLMLFFSVWGGLVAKSTCNKCFKSIPALICRWRKDSTRSSNLFFTWPLTLCGISRWVPKRWFIDISFLFFLKKMYPDLFVSWLDFRFLRPASLESFPLLVISVIKHIINHHHHMWLVWSVSQARQGLEMYAQSHTIKEYHIISWLVKSSSIYIKERERERGGRRLTAPVLEVVETRVIGRFQDHVHSAEPGAVHLVRW